MKLAVALMASMAVTAALDALADAKSGEKKGQVCLLCHKPERVAVPLLEAQPQKFLVAATTAYKTGKRTDSAMQMQPNVAPLSARDIADIASYFASRPPTAGAFKVDADKVAAGQGRVEALKCATCHGASFAGGDLVPRLAGQSPQYMFQQLEAFAASKRTHPGVEPSLVSLADFEPIAHHLASLK